MESSRLIDTLEIRDFSKKMNATYGFIRQNFTSFWKCLILIAGPPIIIGGIFMGDIFNRFMSMDAARYSSGYIDNEYNYFSSAMFWMQVLGIFLFLWIGGVVTIATTYGYLKAYHENKRADIPLAEVWKNVRQSFWRQFWTMVLFSTITGVIILIASLPIFFVIGFVGSTVWIIGVILMIVFVVLAVYFTSNFFMIFICREMEELSFGDTIQRILYLIKGKTWSTCGLTSLNLYIQYGISTLLFIPWYIVQLVALTHTLDRSEMYNASGFLSVFNMFFIIVYFLLYILLYTIPMLAIGFQYFNLVETKESRGLMQNIDTFGTKMESVNDEHY
jgi:hypothetical protein